MGAPSKKVWELVHSLTPSENQRFYERAFQHRRGKYSNYVTLYDALKELAEFDNELLKKKIAKAPFSGYLHRVKNYLYDRILEFVLDSKVDGERKIYEIIKRIKFLFEKRLYSHLPDLIGKGLELANELEDFKSHLKLLQYKRQLLQVEKDWKSISEPLAELGALEISLLSKEQEILELTQLRDKLLIGSLSDSKPEHREEVRSRLESRDSPMSETARVLIGRIKYNLALRSGDIPATLEAAVEIVETFRNSPGLLQDYGKFKAFILATFNAANFCIYFNQLERGAKIFELITSVGDAEKREPALYHEVKALHDIALGIHTANFPIISSAVEEFESLPPEIANNLDPTLKIEIYHTSAVGLIIFNQFKKALYFVNLIHSEKPKSARPDLRNYARILFIVIHFELENYDMVEQGIRSAKIALKRKKAMNIFYESVFQLFGQLINSPGKENQVVAFKEFQLGFTDLETKGLWSTMNNYFNIRAWIIAKMEKRPLSEVLIEIYTGSL